MSICSQHINTMVDLHKNPRNKRLTSLQKGGSIIQTKIGNIQYGIPPETLKDALEQNLEVPEYYIIPDQTFDKNTGINLMEFEFPVYYNFFLKKMTKTKIICNEITMKQIKAIFQETLLGPLEFKEFNEDFIEDYDAKPDMKKELEYFAKHPNDPSQKLSTDMFLEFLLYDENDKKLIQKEIQIDGNKEVVEILIIKNKNNIISLFENNKLLINFEKDIVLAKEFYLSYKKINVQTEVFFNPPAFGVTMLGNSHGFDIGDSTSGFILWINKRGIMIDPPPFASNALQQRGVPSNLIEKVIISHCHADHDAGAFHKILEATQIEFISTKTIVNSFLRKYSAVSQMNIKELKELFDYRIVKIGHPTYILGARFLFSYAFHSIPSLRFEVEYQGKKFFFSSDTFYHPTKLKELQEMGIMSQRRYEELANVDFTKYDLILHEAGIPPIHTPMEVLMNLPESVKQKMHLYHVAANDIPKDCGLKSIEVGLNNSISILDEIKQDTLSNLDLICSLEIINWLPLKRIPEVLGCFTEKQYKKGDVIIQQGSSGDSFYIIKWGTLRVFGTDEQGIESWNKFYYRGDFFGETVMLNKGPRLASVICETDSILLEMKKEDFNWVFRKQTHKVYYSLSFMKMIENLSNLRQSNLSEIIYQNLIISRMTELQKCFLNTLLEPCKIYDSQKLWEITFHSPFCFFIISAVIKITVYQNGIPQLIITNDPNFQSPNPSIFIQQAKPADLVGDFPHLISGKSCSSSAICVKEGDILLLNKNKLLEFIKRYPGFLIVLKQSYLVGQLI